MSYALVDSENNVLAYPVSPIEMFPPNTAFTDECLPDGVVFVSDAPCRPSASQYAYSHAEFLDGIWQQIWTYEDRAK